MKSLPVLLGLGVSAASLFAQPKSSGANVTGQVILVRTVNILQQAQLLQQAPVLQRAQLPGAQLREPSITDEPFITEAPSITEEKPDVPAKFPIPQDLQAMAESLSLPDLRSSLAVSPGNLALANLPGLPVSPGFNGSGFDGLTHRDQRLSNGGNQFSIEPPNPSIAVGNGLVLEGVNNAIQVYSASGSPLLPKAVSSNQVFGLLPAINRSTNVRGPILTDMRVFYDQGINRWFVLQRSLDSDSAGNSLGRSHLYIAVSQTADPTAIYNIYSMDTTNSGNPGCPCLPDYPQIGADQYGFYVSANEYNAFSSPPQFLDVAILAISKTSLASGASLPTAYRVLIRPSTGYEFAVQPATTPPGASYFVGSNGLEYFISSVPSAGDHVAIWALSNTSSLETADPKPALSQVITPALPYTSPDVVSQRPGPLPYGSTLRPPGLLAKIDGGDSRVLSVSYAGGRLYMTLATQVLDGNGHTVTGGAYSIFSPTFRGGVLSAFSLRQGYLLVNNDHLLRPSIAVNAQGKGAIVFTLVGPDYYPSAAFVPIDNSSTASAIQLAAPGVAPEDGFTGYPDTGFQQVGIARWGDYSAAVAASDGSIWMTAEYIPNAPRTDFANWGTFLIRYTP